MSVFKNIFNGEWSSTSEFDTKMVSLGYEKVGDNFALLNTSNNTKVSLSDDTIALIEAIRNGTGQIKSIDSISLTSESLIDNTDISTQDLLYISERNTKLSKAATDINGDVDEIISVAILFVNGVISSIKERGDKPDMLKVIETLLVFKQQPLTDNELKELVIIIYGPLPHITDEQQIVATFLQKQQEILDKVYNTDYFPTDSLGLKIDSAGNVIKRVDYTQLQSDCSIGLSHIQSDYSIITAKLSLEAYISQKLSWTGGSSGYVEFITEIQN